MKRWLMGLVMMAALAPHSAAASTITLTQSNLGGGFTGPFATVSVSLFDSTHADIAFTSLTNGGYTYLMGAEGAVGLNVNGTVTEGPFTATNSFAGFTPGPVSPDAAGNEDGFGNFNWKGKSDDGFTHSSTSITFQLTRTDGTWVSAVDVLTPNASGNLAAAHIFACAVPCDVENGAVLTGFASGNGFDTEIQETTMPEPASLTLLAAGLVILSRSRHLRRR